MTQFQTVQIQGKGLFNAKMTLTLTDKWLIVRDRLGGEVMRLSPSQANMRVVAMGYEFLFWAIALFLLGLISLGVVVAAISGSGATFFQIFIFFLTSFLTSVLLILCGAFFWRMRNWRKLFLTPDVTMYYLVKPAEVPKLYQLMEMVENWTASKGR